MAILSRFTVLCLSSNFVVHFLDLKIILFYNRVDYYYTRIFLILLLRPVFVIAMMPFNHIPKNVVGATIKLCCRNLIKGINTQVVSLVRYSGPFLKWTKEKLKQMDQRTRKLMTIHKALHPGDDIDKLHVLRKE